MGGYIKKYFPVLCKKYNLPIAPSQIISPWMFGDKAEKTTCLWLKGLSNLVPTIKQKPELEYFEWISKKTGKKKRQPKWCYETARLPATERAKVRSKTFVGVANAMAEQWG